MNVIWHKVWRDLWHNKLRTSLVVIATTVGVFALGMVFGLSGTMKTQMTESHKASVAPHLELYTSLFDQDLAEMIRREPGVADAEGETRQAFRWKLAGETDWRDGTVIARDDYQAQRMYPIELLSGAWPAERALAVERMSANYYSLPAGTEIVVEVGRREYHLPITGVARHPYTPPPQIGMGNATFCATLETVAWLTGQPEGFDNLNVRLEAFSQEAAEEANERIQDRLKRMGMSVGYWDIVEPGVHWAQEILDVVFLILGVLGALSLALSGFLVINVMNATIVQQVWQIGVMKVVGATFGRVARVYLVTAATYGLLSLLLAVPLGAAAAHFMSMVLLDFFNIVFDGFGLVPAAILIQVTMGLAVPLLAALVPVISGARTTPHKAISSHGLGGSFGQGRLDRLLGAIRHLPRPLALSLRNTFRRKGRVALTLLTLLLGGIMFLMVLSVRASFHNTLDVLLADFGFDVLFAMEQPYHTTRLTEVGEHVPGVERMEVWDRYGGQLALGGEDDRELEVGLWGVPAHSEMFSPRLTAGRELRPDDDRAILLNAKIAAEEGFQVGDQVEMTIKGRETTWTVVGLIRNINNDFRDNFVPFEALARVTGSAGRGSLVTATLTGEALADEAKVFDDLRQAFAGRRMEVVYRESASELRQRNLSTFDIITYLMLAMAILAAVVGSVGLLSTMSINVVERGREIGMMRAIGATSLTIVGIFVAEGVLIGVLSWLLAAPLSYPGAWVFSQMIGEALMQVPLDFSYPASSVALWLGIVLFFSALSSLWPALRATRVSVREALAYE